MALDLSVNFEMSLRGDELGGCGGVLVKARTQIYLVLRHVPMMLEVTDKPGKVVLEVDVHEDDDHVEVGGREVAEDEREGVDTVLAADEALEGVDTVLTVDEALGDDVEGGKEHYPSEHLEDFQLRLGGAVELAKHHPLQIIVGAPFTVSVVEGVPIAMNRVVIRFGLIHEA